MVRRLFKKVGYIQRQKGRRSFMGVEVLSDYTLRDKRGTVLLSMGVHRLTGPYTAELHSHHELELSCVRSGHGVYQVGGPPV